MKELKVIIKAIKEVNLINRQIYQDTGSCTSVYEVHTDGLTTQIVFFDAPEQPDYETVWNDSDGTPHTKRKEFRSLLNDHYAKYLGVEIERKAKEGLIDYNSPDSTDIRL